MAEPLLTPADDAVAPRLLDDGLPEYTGRLQPVPGQLDQQGQPLYPYLPSKELAEAVNLARTLNRPLLLKGEPGSGKTRLARAVAFELGLPYFPWYVKSTSRARDGLYSYDAVRRLRDAQLAGSKILSKQEIEDVKDLTNYISLGQLGRAFACGKRAVVLIDEIDKADIDFPNDLLVELDEQFFTIDETKTELRAAVPPIIIITSNEEKDLPDAFLRRCLFHYITFPEREDLIRIIERRFPEVERTIVAAAVDSFRTLREQISKSGEAGKNVSTSELIDWFQVLVRFPDEANLARLQGKLPFPSVLLKSWDHHRNFLAQTSSKGTP